MNYKKIMEEMERSSEERRFEAIIRASQIVMTPMGDYLGADIQVCLLDDYGWPANGAAESIALCTQSEKMKNPDYVWGYWRVKILLLKDLLKQIGEYISDPSNI